MKTIHSKDRSTRVEYQKSGDIYVACLCQGEGHDKHVIASSSDYKTEKGLKRWIDKVLN